MPELKWAKNKAEDDVFRPIPSPETAEVLLKSSLDDFYNTCTQVRGLSLLRAWKLGDLLLNVRTRPEIFNNITIEWLSSEFKKEGLSEYNLETFRLFEAFRNSVDADKLHRLLSLEKLPSWKTVAVALMNNGLVDLDYLRKLGPEAQSESVKQLSELSSDSSSKEASVVHLAVKTNTKSTTKDKKTRSFSPSRGVGILLRQLRNLLQTSDKLVEASSRDFKVSVKASRQLTELLTALNDFVGVVSKITNNGGVIECLKSRIRSVQSAAGIKPGS